MPIRHFLLVTTLLCSSHLGWATTTETFDCVAFLPKADVILEIEKGDEDIQISMDFFNIGLAKNLPGEFTMKTKYFDPIQQDVIASGVFYDGTEQIEAVIQGSLQTNDQGQMLLSIGAGWDHRIEYGYGNYLSCTRQ